jgi:hypothetical protein
MTSELDERDRIWFDGGPRVAAAVEDQAILEARDRY